MDKAPRVINVERIVRALIGIDGHYSFRLPDLAETPAAARPRHTR